MSDSSKLQEESEPMRLAMKAALKSAIRGAVKVASRTSVGSFTLEYVLNDAMSRAERFRYKGLDFVFAAPNDMNRYRISTFATKEPETLEWVDGLPKGAILWDIGANIGLYSCYAAKARDCRVFAFEPSVFNLELLARNIHLDGLCDRITVVPLPLADAHVFDRLNMTNTEWGGSMSSFSQGYGWDGEPMPKVFEVPTVSFSMNDAVERLGIPQPDFMKMDVDGIEHLILKGGAKVLSRIEGVSIEINDAFVQQAEESSRYLNRAGLRFVHKKHSEMIEDTEFNRVFNQVWHRPSAT